MDIEKLYSYLVFVILPIIISMAISSQIEGLKNSATIKIILLCIIGLIVMVGFATHEILTSLRKLRK